MSGYWKWYAALPEPWRLCVCLLMVSPVGFIGVVFAAVEMPWRFPAAQACWLLPCLLAWNYTRWLDRQAMRREG